MNKITSLLLSIVMLISAIVSVNVTAYADIDGYYTYTVYNDKATITKCNTNIEGDIIIPSTLGGYTVTKIGYQAFCGCTGLTSITIPNSVTDIANSAFYGCTSLEKMTIPFTGSSVTATRVSEETHFGYIFGYTSGSFGSYHYYESSPNSSYPNYYTYRIPSSLKSVTVTGGEILPYTFQNCSNLTNIIIPDGVTSVGGSAFRGCSNLTSITIPNRVTSLGASAFRDCRSLTSVTIPEGITSISYEAFYGCSKLTSIAIPVGVKSIGDYAFSNCTSLINIKIPDSVTSIGYSAFANTAYYNNEENWENDALYFGKNLINVKTTIDDDFVFADGTTSIASGAFSYHTGLTGITIPDSVTSIGDSAFCGCTGLTSITIPNSVTSIGSSVFKDCTSLTSVIIKNGLISIGSYAFDNCAGLTSIAIPNSVTSIDNGAFRSCDKLQYIYYGGSEEEWSNIYISSYGNYNSKLLSGSINYNSFTSGDYLYSIIDSNAIIISYFGKDSEITIPDTLDGYTVTSIFYGAFYKCTGLMSVTIPDSVTSIGDYAFCNCSGLKSIVIGNSIISISYHAFDNCSSLTNVTIPDSVTYIGDYAFCDCTSLTNVELGNTVESIGNGAFYECCDLASVVIPDSVTSIGDEVFRCCSSLTSITIPDSVTNIGLNAFFKCSSLTNVEIGNAVKSISDYAFSGCSGINELSIPCSAVVSTNAFNGCTNIAKMKITKGNTIMPDYTETNYKYLPWYISRNSCTSIEIENGVDNIGNYAFKDLLMLRNIIIPESVEFIGTNVFDNCSRLSKITILNDECLIWNNTIPNVTTIEGYDNSSAKKYANDNGNPFKSLGIKPCATHSAVTDAAVAPTCTTAGKTAGSHCSVCGEVIDAQSTVPATGHRVVSANNAVAPTCEAAGRTADTKCSVCGAIITRGTTVAAKGHTVVTDKAVPATYARAGKTEGKHCSTCGKVIVAQRSLAKLTVPKITLSSVKSKKSKQITVTWKKNTKVTGYEIQCSTDKNFKKSVKKVTVSKNSKTSATIKKLKGKTKYYVRIRAYKTEKGKKYYSSWSAKKTVTTKK